MRTRASFVSTHPINDPVTHDRINPTDKERHPLHGLRQCSFYVHPLSGKYASSLMMISRYPRNSFCPVGLHDPECFRYSTVLHPVYVRWRCSMMANKRQQFWAYIQNFDIT